MFVTLSFSVSGAMPIFSGVNASGWNEVQCCVSAAWNAFLHCLFLYLVLMGWYWYSLWRYWATKGHTITDVLKTHSAVRCTLRKWNWNDQFSDFIHNYRQTGYVTITRHEFASCVLMWYQGQIPTSAKHRLTEIDWIGGVLIQKMF